MLYFCLGGLIRLILYRLVRYRRQVVRTNLAHSFPEKSEAERREIERKFYHHLSEVFVDTILLASISRKRICERMVYSNVEESRPPCPDAAGSPPCLISVPGS